MFAPSHDWRAEPETSGLDELLPSYRCERHFARTGRLVEASSSQGCLEALEAPTHKSESVNAVGYQGRKGMEKLG